MRDSLDSLRGYMILLFGGTKEDTRRLDSSSCGTLTLWPRAALILTCSIPFAM